MWSAFIKWLAKTEFARNAVAEKADLGAFRQKPTPKMIFSIFLLIISYVICWPLVVVLGSISLYLENPLVAVIGVPLAIVLSYLVFLLGVSLGAADYVKVFLRWMIRTIVEKYASSRASA